MSNSLRLSDVKPPCLNSPGTSVPGVFFIELNTQWVLAAQCDVFPTVDLDCSSASPSLWPQAELWYMFPTNQAEFYLSNLGEF